MRNGKSHRFKNQHILLILILICILSMILCTTQYSPAPIVKNAVEAVFSPFQKGLNYMGGGLVRVGNVFRSKADLVSENETLKSQIATLTEENNALVLQTYEVSDLKKLYQLDQEYSDYEKVGAYVIAKDTSNYYDIFTINKGSDDGIAVNMNVIADGGLVGIVTSVSKSTATVRAIIDDASDVSAMILDSQDNCIVSGSLSRMNAEQAITFSELKTSASGDASVSAGNAVVTSYISDRYLPGLLIGYVKTAKLDSNSLMISGTITPVVDFEHLSEVLVILETKEQVGD